MKFNKDKISTKHFLSLKKRSNLLSNIIWLFSVIFIFFMWSLLLKNMNVISFDFVNKIVLELDNNYKDNNNEDINETKIPLEELDGKINILILWRWWGLHDAPELTDTIILSSINTVNKTVSLLSIPRDLYVEYDNWSKWKINEIYLNNWINSLIKKIKQVTNQRVDYYINIDFNWFTKIIDTIWWIEIEIPNNFVDDKYPDWNLGYKTLIFKKWKWLFDWDNALKYARSRHSTSDFDRSLRQQQLIKWVKDKLLSWYFLTSPTKIKDFYDIFIKYVKTNLGLKQILQISYLVSVWNDLDFLSFNLNDSCFYGTEVCEKWGFLYIPNRDLFWWISVLLLEWTDKARLNDYSIIHKYTDLIFNNTLIYKENHQINVFNSVKVNFLASSLWDKIKKYWFNIPTILSIWNTKKIYKKSLIYYNNIDKNSVTLKALKKLCNVEFIKVDNPVYSKDPKTKIEIIIWEDYIEEDNNNNKFYF